MYFRKLKTNDEYLYKVCESLAQFHTKSTKKELLSYCLNNVYIMVVNNELVGYFSYSRYDKSSLNICNWMFSYCISIIFKRMFMYDVFVFPLYRGNGYGIKLVKHAKNIIKQNHPDINFIEGFVTDCKLIKFYAINNFSVYNKTNSLYHLICHV